MVLIAPVPGHCLLLPFVLYGSGANIKCQVSLVVQYMHMKPMQGI